MCRLVQPIAETLVKEVAKPKKDSVTEVVRSGDFLSYTAGAPPDMPGSQPPECLVCVVWLPAYSLPCLGH